MSRNGILSDADDTVARPPPALQRRRPARQGEGALSDAIREALAYEPGLLLFRNSAAVVKSRGRFYKGGLGNGSADLVGVLAVGVWVERGGERVDGIDRTIGAPLKVGRFVALEVKVPGKDAEPHQAAWLADVRERGGFACVVHSPLEALAAIRRARNGASS